MRNAIVATEDKRFWSHFGVDPIGIAGAIRINLIEGRGPLEGHGGSSITQQVAKLLCLGRPFDPAIETEAEYETDCRRGSLIRKIKEVPFALAMEARYSKEEILTIYLNRAYLGAGARGFEAAAQRYFGKSAANVDAAEAAMLAGLLVAPSRFAPTANLARAQGRANVIVGLMADQGYISAAEAKAARANPAELSEAAEARAGGYFADWVMDQGPAFLTSETTEDVIVRTTFDPAHPERRRSGAQGGLRRPGQEGLEGAGGHRGDVLRRRGARDGRRTQAARRGRPVQPRHPGQAPDGQRVQALRLRRRARHGLRTGTTGSRTRPSR